MSNKKHRFPHPEWNCYSHNGCDPGVPEMCKKVYPNLRCLFGRRPLPREEKEA